MTLSTYIAVPAPSSISRLPPELPPERLQSIAILLKTRDLFSFACVCTSWSDSVSSDFNTFWRSVIVMHDFPFYEGEERDFKADFIMLYKTAGICRKEIINKYLGKIGDVPSIAKERFEWLCQIDPWDNTKLRRDTYEWNIVPSHVVRLEEKFSLSFGNLVFLCENPLSETKYAPVFKEGLSECLLEFDHSEVPPEGVNVCFMRKRGVTMGCLDNKIIASTRQIAPMYMEALRNALFILEFGDCPLSGKARKITRVPGSTPDYARMMTIGNFVRGEGLKIGRFSEELGTTLWVSATAGQPAPVIDKGL